MTFVDTNINQIIHHNKDSGSFANVWSTLIFLSHTYNFLTVWYFLGLEGFPQGLWLVAELLVEVFLLVDFGLRLCLKSRMPSAWTTMWLLQHSHEPPFDPPGLLA